ncbi:MAG: hypothetical protein WCP34_10170, partial [Pseudomonadota bacterium]
MKRSLIAATVGLCMAVGAATVRADAILFPYYVSDPAAGVVSFITLVNGGNTTVDTHYVWSRKLLTQSGGFAPPQGACEHFDTWGRLTAWDMVRQGVMGPSIAYATKVGQATFDLPKNDVPDASIVAYDRDDRPLAGFLIVG